jgi:hypothetical protein
MKKVKYCYAFYFNLSGRDTVQGKKNIDAVLSLLRCMHFSPAGFNGRENAKMPRHS